MIRTACTVTALAAMLTLIGCSTLSVSYDYDNNVDFTSYKSFAWMAVPDAVPADAAQAQQRNGLLDSRIRNAIDNELVARGLAKDAAAPGLLVVYHIGLQDKVQVTDYGYHYSPYYWGGYGSRQLDVYQYQEGTLIIDLVDAGTKDLVWRGTGSKVIEGGQMTPEQMQAKVNDVVGKIMQSYPPKG